MSRKKWKGKGHGSGGQHQANRGGSGNGARDDGAGASGPQRQPDVRAFRYRERMPVEAPYNFVPLSDVVLFADAPETISQDRPLSDGLCGTLRFWIEAETRLSVGGERTKAGKEAPGFVRFLRTPDGRLCIGGSSVRGMVRNVLEIATFGKFSLIDGDRRFAMRDLSGPVSGQYTKLLSDQSRRAIIDGSSVTCFKPKSQAGWLEYDKAEKKWKIQPCNFARIEQNRIISNEDIQSFRRFDAPRKYSHWKSKGNNLHGHAVVGPLEAQRHTRETRKGVEVYGTWERIASGFTSAVDGSTPSAGAKTGELVFTGQVPRKHKEFFFFDPAGEAKAVPPAVMQRFMEVQEARMTRAMGDGDDRITHWQYLKNSRLKRGRPIPVFYLADESGDVSDLGLSLMFPFPYKHSVGDLANGQQEGRNSAAPDWAEAIFGTIGDDAAAAGRPGYERGLKGRVSFSLARAADGSAVAESDPKDIDAGILSEPKPSFYPAYLEQKPGGPVHTYMNADAKLRGWKRYPVRQEPGKPAEMEENLKPKYSIQTKLEYVPPGTRFEGRLRFHNLRPFELGAVLWAMTFGDPAGPHRHTLGTGKPWGYGRVRITIDEADWTRDVRPNREDGAPVPTAIELLSAFENEMAARLAAALSGSPGNRSWRTSEQIEALLAMADPANAPDGRNAAAGYLQTMPLKPFGEARKNRWSLGRYEPRPPPAEGAS